MRVKVTIVVEVDVSAKHLPLDDVLRGDVRREAEEIARQADSVAVRALEAAGFDPVSCGYGFEVR